MIALRVVMRMGWAMPNPASALNGDRIGCPFAYLEPETAVTTQAVTFTVEDNDSPDPNPIEGAIVDDNGSRLLTDSSGEAVFNLRAGAYPVAVSKQGFATVRDIITVESSPVSKEITLI